MRSDPVSPKRCCVSERFRLVVTGEVLVSGCLQPAIDAGIFDAFTHMMGTADAALGGVWPTNVVIPRRKNSGSYMPPCSGTLRHLSDIGFNLIPEVSAGSTHAAQRLGRASMACTGPAEPVSVVHFAIGHSGKPNESQLPILRRAVHQAREHSSLAIACVRVPGALPHENLMADVALAFAIECARAGAHLVVCYGLRGLRPLIIHNGVPILCGLGTFVEQGSSRSSLSEAALATVTFSGTTATQIEFQPIEIFRSSPSGMPRIPMPRRSARIARMLRDTSTPHASFLRINNGTAIWSRQLQQDL